MLTLSHNQQIKVRGFVYEPVITVHTIPGCAKDDGQDPQESIAQQVKFGHSINPFAIKHAGILTADYKGKQADLDAKHLAFVNSPEVCAGQVVEIEGKTYTVKIVGQDYSDPIHFIPA